jgi:DNA-directed RNA polymerase alpha subunit
MNYRSLAKACGEYKRQETFAQHLRRQLQEAEVKLSEQETALRSISPALFNDIESLGLNPRLTAKLRGAGKTRILDIVYAYGEFQSIAGIGAKGEAEIREKLLQLDVARKDNQP